MLGTMRSGSLRRSARSAALGSFSVAAVLGLSACGSPAAAPPASSSTSTTSTSTTVASTTSAPPASSSTTTSSTSTSTSTTVAGPKPCDTPQVKVTPSTGQGGAGTLVQRFIVKNVGTVTCTMLGHPDQLNPVHGATSLNISAAPIPAGFSDLGGPGKVMVVTPVRRLCSSSGGATSRQGTARARPPTASPSRLRSPRRSRSSGSACRWAPSAAAPSTTR